MKILLILESFILRESLINLFSKIENVDEVIIKYSVEDINNINLSYINFIFIESSEENLEYLNIVNEQKKYRENIKVMLFDLNKNKKIFVNSVKKDVDGYILNISSESEFVYKVNKIIEGRKIYDVELLKEIFNEKNSINKIEKLTPREKEVMELVGTGIINKEISQKLFVTEYTVKKHISSILNKLNLKNRKDIILYYKNNINNEFLHNNII